MTGKRALKRCPHCGRKTMKPGGICRYCFELSDELCEQLIADADKDGFGKIEECWRKLRDTKP